MNLLILHPATSSPHINPSSVPDISAARDRRSHGGHFLANSYAPSQLSQGDGSSDIPDEQEVSGRRGVGKARGPKHAGLDGQLMLAGVQLPNEGGLLLGL